MAGAAETGTGHGEDAFVKELVDEGHVVAAGSLREEIKRAFGHLEFIARVGEDVAHHFAAAGINVHVHLRSERARHDMLAHDRGVHKAEDTVGERQAAHEFGAFGEERGQGDEADAFTGEAQVLGEGACQNGVGVHGQQARHFHAVEGQKTVRFVDHEIERTAIAFGGLGEDGGQAFELFAGIDGPGGVVGRVDDHGAGLGRDGRLNGGQIKPEGARQGRDLLERTAVVAHIGAVFHEIGGHGEHFVAGLQNGPEDHVERARGPAGQDDVVGRELYSLFLGKVGGELFAGPAEPVVRHVAEAERFVHVLDEFGQRLANGGRGSEIRVPEAEIAYGVVAVLLLELDAGFEHATDPGAVFDGRTHLGADDAHGCSVSHDLRESVAEGAAVGLRCAAWA